MSNSAKKLIVYSDGGARGNPGPAAIAFLIIDKKDYICKKVSRFLGKRTNNQAEYEALIAALEASASLEATEVTSHLDSEVVTKQLTGEYRVRNRELQQLWKKVQELKRCFISVRFVSVPRSESHIQEVDRLVNATLDEAFERVL